MQGEMFGRLKIFYAIIISHFSKFIRLFVRISGIFISWYILTKRQECKAKWQINHREPLTSSSKIGLSAINMSCNFEFLPFYKYIWTAHNTRDDNRSEVVESEMIYTGKWEIIVAQCFFLSIFFLSFFSNITSSDLSPWIPPPTRQKLILN